MRREEVMAVDTDVLIIGAGMSGLGLAVQLIRMYNLRSFEIVEKSGDVGGTWNVNTYPGCGCDVSFFPYPPLSCYKPPPPLFAIQTLMEGFFLQRQV